MATGVIEKKQPFSFGSLFASFVTRRPLQHDSKRFLGVQLLPTAENFTFKHLPPPHGTRGGGAELGRGGADQFRLPPCIPPPVVDAGPLDQVRPARIVAFRKPPPPPVGHKRFCAPFSFSPSAAAPRPAIVLGQSNLWFTRLKRNAE